MDTENNTCPRRQFSHDTGMYYAYNATYADTLAELGSIRTAYLALCTMPIMPTHMLNWEVLGTAYLALCTMPIMPTHMLNWEVLGLHIWHCVQCQLCRHTC